DAIKRQGLNITELHIDRAYVTSPVVDEVMTSGGTIYAKPWPHPNRPGLYPKDDFKLDLRRGTITCPAGQVEYFEPGKTGINLGQPLVIPGLEYFAPVVVEQL